MSVTAYLQWIILFKSVGDWNFIYSTPRYFHNLKGKKIKFEQSEWPMNQYFDLPLVENMDNLQIYVGKYT